MKFLLLVSAWIVGAERIGSPNSHVEFDHYHRKLVAASYPGNNGRPTSAYPLKVCQGDCDNDDECEGNLKCFERSGQESIPGCTGLSSRWSGIDFCYDPSADSPTPTTSAPTTSAPTTSAPTTSAPPTPALSPLGTIAKVGDDGSPSSVFPLKRCQGDW
jgi:hypothetical protein